MPDESFHKYKILHVDDDLDFLEVFSLYYDKWLDIVSLNNPLDIFEYLERSFFDAVITDYEMPQMNGIELLKRIRDVFPDIPVIFYTGQGNEHVAREAFMSGVSDYYQKNLFEFAHREKFINSLVRAVKSRRTEEVVQENQQRYRMLAENMSDVLWTLNPSDLSFSYVTPSVTQLLGYGQEEILSLRFADIARGDNIPVFVDYLRSMGKPDNTVSPLILELDLLHRQGYLIPVEMKANFIHTGKGSEILGVIRDISQRKEIEQNLRLQRELDIMLSSFDNRQSALEKIMDMALRIRDVDSGGIYLMDPETGDLHLSMSAGISPAFRKMVSHYGKDSVHARLACNDGIRYVYYPDLLESLDVDDPLRDAEGIRAVAVIPIFYGDEMIAVFNLASHTCHQFSNISRTAMESMAYRVGAIVYNMRSDDRIRASEEKFRNLFFNNNDVMYLADPETLSFLDVNRACERFYGYTREEFRTMKISDINPLSEEKIRELLESALELKQDRFLLKHRNKNGQIRQVEVRFTPLLLPSGQNIYYAVVKDVSDAVRNREVMKTRHRILDVFFSDYFSEDFPALLTDPLFNIIQLNGPAREMNQYLKASNVLKFLGVTDRDTAGRIVLNVRTCSMAGSGECVENIAGRTFHVVPVYEKNGILLGYFFRGE